MNINYTNTNKKAVLYSNAANDRGLSAAARVSGLLRDNGWETTVYEYPEMPELGDADMLITFGGDGTILHAAGAAARADVPVLGINMGGKGFIAELEPDDTELILKAAGGEYDIETRMMIDIEVLRGGKAVHRDYALNDAVIKGDNKVIEMTVSADGQKITGFAGDGTVIATPTGSTAYSMSAGGPIVEPMAENIIVTPICAHILGAKSFVLKASRIITIKIEGKKDTPAYLSADGGEHFSVCNGDIIRVYKSSMSTGLIRLSGKSFYHRLSAKLATKN